MARKQVGASPTAATDAATKEYVDSRPGGGDVTEAELATALAAKASKTGDTFTGDVNVNGADFYVKDEALGKAYRFRRGGGGLDYEAGGADLVFSMWANSAFSGGQLWYDKYGYLTQLASHTGRREFTTTLFGGTVQHVIDPNLNVTGWYGATPVGRQTVTGTRGGNPGVASLLAGLAAQGWITNSTTAGETLALVAKTANYTLTAADSVVTFNGSNLTATLPGFAAVPAGTVLRIKNLAATNLTVAGTVDGVTTQTLAQYGKLTVIATSAKWLSI